MIGDKLTYHSNFKNLNTKIISKLQHQFQRRKRLCIAIGGESGSGKTSLAYTLQLDIEKILGLKGFIFQADDYFYLPPKDNHNKRLKDITKVGPLEVNLKLLDTHLLSFINATQIKKPLVDYSANAIKEETINSENFNFCIVEGTYTMLLKHPMFKLFIEDSFITTKKNRLKRARDIMNDFNEKVLKIEHNIIKTQISHADMVIKNNTY